LPETGRERPVGGDDPGARADRGGQHGRVATTLGGDDRVPAGEQQGGGGTANASGREAFELLESGGGDRELRPGAETVDLRLEREARPDREQEGVRVEQHRPRPARLR